MIVYFPVSNMEKGCLKQVLKTYFETPPWFLLSAQRIIQFGGNGGDEVAGVLVVVGAGVEAD